MATYNRSCEACETLKDISTNVVFNGIGDTECASLKKDTGLNPDLTVLHTNCEDLDTLLECFIGEKYDSIDMHNNCDWKGFMKGLIGNFHEVLKAMMCGDCGQWSEIHLLWEETEKLWAETEKLWAETEKLWAETEKLWAETEKLWAETVKIWNAIYSLQQEVTNIWAAIASIRSDITEINSQITSIKNQITVINNSITNINNQITTINNRLNSIDNSIIDIYTKIDDLQSQLDALGGVNLDYLTPGTDYTCGFYNGFGTPSGYVRVGYVESSEQVNLTITTPANASGWETNYFRLNNADLLANDVNIRHTYSVTERPNSRTFWIDFNGAFSKWNDYSFRNTTSSASGIWNLLPRSARASWQANCPLTNNHNGHKLTASISQYADGYNSQFSYYSDLTTSLETNGINSDLSCILIKN